MSGRRTQPAWWQDIRRGERLNNVEWLLLGVSGLALGAALLVLARVAS